MTLFEYLSVALSIVLSFATIRLLSGLSFAFLHGKRYWPHAMWIALSLLTGALVWWNFWSFRTVEWNLLFFLAALAVPSCMYLLAVGLVPERPGRVPSWREHFFAARKRIFVALSAFYVVVIVDTWLLLSLPLLHPVRGVQIAALMIACCGACSANERLHKILPVAFLLVVATAATMFFLQPAALGLDGAV